MRKNKKYIDNLNKFCGLADHIDGDIIEIGTYDGDDAEIICSYLHNNNLNKKYIGVDTFEGYLEEDLKGANKQSWNNYKSGRWKTSPEALMKRLEGFNNYELHIGDSKKILPVIVGKQISSLSIIYIDCNLYYPSLKAMRDLYPVLSKSGIIAIDEHLTGGETKAIKEFAKETNNKLKYFEDIGPSYYFFKK